MPANPDALEILWQDNSIIAVAKPAGLASIPGRGETDSVAGRMQMKIVHRLDKETSGVMLLARDTAAQRHVSMQFQNNQVEKEYLALVAGRPAGESGVIEAPIGVHPAIKKRMAVLKHGRPARTDWRIEGQFGALTLLRCFPRTGKTHQIRVHLAHIGVPLAVDPLYNPRSAPIFLSHYKRSYRRSAEPERPLLRRLSLHAHRLTFTDLSGQRITVECPPPKDFRATLSMLSRHARA